jgi:hypothetical protein
MPGMALIALIAFLMGIASTAALNAQERLPEQALSARAELDWVAGTIRAYIAIDIVQAGIRLPSGRAEAERVIARMAPSLVKDAVLAVQVDSYRSVLDGINDGSLEASALNAFLEGGTRLKAVMSQDLRRLETEYRWELPALARLFARHSAPLDLPLATSYVPSRPYSGIIIYLQDELPVRGEQLEGSAQPCLLPSLYDDEMNLIMDRKRIEQPALINRLPVAYAFRLDDPVIEARAGGDPLRIMASALFGSSRTDAVIPRSEALKILADPANRELVRQGRVVFVILER